jgi:hypothetical protein
MKDLNMAMERLLLCDAEHETSVIDMLCRDNKAGGFVSTVGRSIVSIFKDTWQSQEEAEPGVSLTVVNLLYDNIWSSSRTPSFHGHPFGTRSFLFHP